MTFKNYKTKNETRFGYHIHPDQTEIIQHNYLKNHIFDTYFGF